MHMNMLQIKAISSFSFVHVVLNGTPLAIQKPIIEYLEDYYYFKSGKYAMHVQTTIDSKNRFINICVGVLDSMNDNNIQGGFRLLEGLKSTVAAQYILDLCPPSAMMVELMWQTIVQVVWSGLGYSVSTAMERAIGFLV